MPRLLAAFPAVAGLQQIVDRIGGGVDVYSALGVFKMERLSRTAFQYGSCRLFVWRRCSPVQQMSAHRSVLQAALLRQSLIARFGACIEGFAHLDSTQTRMAHSSVCCSSSASSLRSYDPPNPSVERSFAKSRESRSLQALAVTSLNW